MATSKDSSRHLVDDEQSPLLRASGESEHEDAISPIGNIDDHDGDDYIGEEHEFKSSWYMFLLTLGGFG
jgi:hypothetical protein